MPRFSPGRFVALALASVLLVLLGTVPAQAQRYSFQDAVPQEPNGSLDEPKDMAVSLADSTVYVADAGDGLVTRYKIGASSEPPLRSVRVDGASVALEEPVALDIGPEGTLFIADAGTNQIFAVHDDSTRSYAMGRGGGGVFSGANYGELDGLKDIAVGPSGRTYALEGGNQHVVLFNDEGRYLSWIRGHSTNFEEPIAIGTNGARQLYVLEPNGPRVTIFGPNHEPVRTLSRLNSSSSVSIEEPTDLAVLPGGDFLILDQSNGRLTHFSRTGDIIGTFGTLGSGQAGTFAEPRSVGDVHGAPSQAAILDVETQQVQRFQIPARPDTLSAPAAKMGVRGLASESPPPFVDLVRRPGGRLYYIPRSNRSRVYGRDSTGSTTSIQVDEAQALAVHERSLYVLDRGTNTIREYDRQGALVREFGSNVPGGLDEPSDLTTLPSGSILLTDRGEGAVHLWNQQGLYQQKMGLSSALRAPAAIAAHDSTRLYVWDTELNRILEFQRTGSSFQTSSLTLRTQDVGAGDGGEVGGLAVDPLDYVHTFNRTTNQYAIYSWTDQPEPLLRFGRKGEGENDFDNVLGFGLDRQNFVAHVLNNDGENVKSIQFAVRPPVPSDSIRFRNQGDTLLAQVPPINNPVAVKYGLLRKTPSGPPDTVVTRAAPSLPLPARADTAGVPQYAVISLSPTSASAPTSYFPDYFGRGNRLFAQGNYEAALQSYRRALDSLNVEDGVAQFVGRRYARLGREFASRYDFDQARPFLEAARSLAPNDSVTVSALGHGYSQQLRKLGNESRYDSLRTLAGTFVQNTEDAPQAQAPVLAVVDSVAQHLQSRSTPERRAEAVALYKNLRSWSDTGGPPSYKLARAQWALYKAKRRTGAPSFEQDVALDNALSSAESAVDRLPNGEAQHHEATLLLLDLLLEKENHERVVSLATKALDEQSGSFGADTEAAYRQRRAQAYQGQGKYKAAIRAYRQLLNSHPDSKTYKLALAGVLVENENYSDAKTLYQELRTKYPDDATLVAQLGELQLKRGNFTESSYNLQEALEMNPNLQNVRGLLARAYDGASNYSNAIETYNAAIQEARRTLDTTRTGDTGAAQTQETEKRLKTYLGNLGRVHMQLGQYDDAIGAFSNLTELAGSNAEAWHELGKAYLNSGRVYQALSALNRALNLNPSSQSIDQNLSRARSLRDKVSENRPPVEIVATEVNPLYPSLYRNYSDASALPIGSVVLANNTDLPKQNVSVTFYVEDLMDSPTQQQSKPLQAFSNTTIPLSAVFNESILENSEKQKVQGQLTLTYRQDGTEETVEKSLSFTLYGRNAIKWKDKRRLAAFVSPRDQEMIDFTKAVDQLFRNQPTFDLPSKVITATQIYTTLNQQGYTYSVDPQTDFSVVSRNPEMLDYCQFPVQTMKRKGGDCDDLVALYLSALANAGVSVAYVDIPGHVMSAFDAGLSPEELRGSGLSRDQVIVENDRVWIPVETTLLGSKSFMTAWQQGIERYREEQEAGTLPEIVSLAEAREVYEPASLSLSDFSPSLPSDTSAVLSSYRDQASTLYARKTQSERRQLRQQLDEQPGNTIARNQLGILLARSGKLAEARSLYEEGLKRLPSSSLLLNNYGNVLYQQGNYEQAIETYNKSLNVGSTDPQVYINLCKAQLALGRTSNAASSFESAIEQDPSLADTYSYLQEKL